MAFWDPPWKKVKNRLLSRLEALNVEIYQQFLRNIGDLQDSLHKFGDFQSDVNNTVVRLLNTGTTRRGTWILYQSALGHKANAFRRSIRDFVYTMKYQIEGLRQGRLVESQSEFLYGGGVRVRKGRILNILEDVEKADESGLLNVISLDENEEVYTIKELEKTLRYIINNFDIFYKTLISLLDYMVKHYSWGDWKEVHKENREKAEHLYHEVKRELNIIDGLMHRFRRKIIHVFEEAKAEFQAVGMKLQTEA